MQQKLPLLKRMKNYRSHSLFLTVFLLFFVPFHSEGLIKKTSPTPLKTSIIVPCYYKHFDYIFELLTHLQNQTILPDEVVVSLSECNKVPQETLETVLNTPWPFLLKVLQHEGKMSEGQNRNSACQASFGDVLICQDADDLPHPQRVEIIKYLFETYLIDHLIHQYTAIENSFQNYDNDYVDVQTYYSRKYWKINVPDITNGNVALTREVFQKVKWGEKHQIGQDVQFNQRVYSLFTNKAIAELKLLLYRNQFSSYN